MNNNLKFSLASLALAASFGTQLSAMSPELEPAEVSAVVETVEEIVEAVEETVAAKAIEEVSAAEAVAGVATGQNVKSEQAELISKLLKQISEQKDPSTQKELLKEPAYFAVVALVGGGLNANCSGDINPFAIGAGAGLALASPHINIA